MTRKEGRWLISVIMSIVMTVSVLASPLTAMALDGEGGENHNYAHKYVNSDGQEIGVDITDDGYVYNQVNSDGQEVVKIYGYLGKEKTLNVPAKINNIEVASFAIDPRWPVEEENYDGIETINLPNTLQTAHAKFMNYYRGLKAINIAEGNPVYKSVKGVLYKVNGDGYKVAAYPRAKSDKEFVMPDDMNKFYKFFDGCQVESLTISKAVTSVKRSYFRNLKNLKSLKVDKDNPYFYSKDNALIEKIDESFYWGDGQYIEIKYNVLIFYPVESDAEEYTVPEDVIEIRNKAFYGVKHLKKLTLSTGIRNITYNAFCKSYWYMDEADKEKIEKPSIRTLVFTSKTAPKDYWSFSGIKNLYSALGDELTIKYPEDSTGYEEFIAHIKNYKVENDWEVKPSTKYYEYPLGANFDAIMKLNGLAMYGDETRYTVFSDKADGEYTKTVPSTVGTWYAKQVINEGVDYTELESEPIKFKIVQPDPEKQYDNRWLPNPRSINTWYGRDYVVKGTALFGEPKVLYGDENADPDKDEDWTEEKPIEPGTYKYKLIIDETDAYKGIDYWSWIDIHKYTVGLDVVCDDVVLGNKPNPTVSFDEGQECDYIDLSKVTLKYYDWYTDEEVTGEPKKEGRYIVRPVYDSDYYDVYGGSIFYLLSKVNMAEKYISELPSPKRVSIKDKEDVQKAADAFAALTDDEKKTVSEESVQKLEKVQNKLAELEAKEKVEEKADAHNDASATSDDAKRTAEQSKKAAEEAAATPGEAAVSAAAKAKADAEIVKTASAALLKAAEAYEAASKEYAETIQNDPLKTKRDKVEARKAAEEAALLVEKAKQEIESADKAFDDAVKAYDDSNAKWHTLTKHDEVKATCTSEGTKAYWECTRHENELYSDAEGEHKIEKPESIPMLPHALVKTPAKASTPVEEGNKEYWTCSECGHFFSDEAGTNEIAKDSWIIPKCGKYTNTMKVSAKKVTLKAKALSKNKKTVKKAKAFTIKKAKGTVTFKLSKEDKKAKNKIIVSKKGTITVKKGLKKGKYTIKVKVTAAGNASYKKLTKEVKVKVIVK